MTTSQIPLAIIRKQFISRRLFLLVVFFVFFAVGVVLAYPSLSYYWFNDDLIMIRLHTNEEITRTFTGDWEPSGISTPGYRPFTVLFNHLTSVFFGETVEIHRLFRIGVFALHLTILGLIGLELRMSQFEVLVSGILILCTKNTWWVLTWPADGIRAFTILLAEGSAYLFLGDLKKPNYIKLLLAILLFVSALLTREDIVIFIGIIPSTWAVSPERT